MRKFPGEISIPGFYGVLLTALSLAFLVFVVTTPRAEGLLNTAPLPVAPAAMPESAFRGCFGEISTSGQFIRSGSEGTIAGGLGCDVLLANRIILGGAVRYDFSDAGFQRQGSIIGRVGLEINPSTVLYGLAEWRAKDFKLADDGALYLGGGIETSIFTPGMTIFLEASQVVARDTPFVFQSDDAQMRVGGRIRFNGLVK